MIPLRFKVDARDTPDIFVARLNANPADSPENPVSADMVLVKHTAEWTEFTGTHGTLRLFAPPEDLDGDILLVIAGRGTAHRLIRSNSRHNTLLVTERCDQLCVMCSQPPKKNHVDLFPYFQQAALLAPRDCTIGISGGEPTLYKSELFSLLETVQRQRPDISFHILTNAQHFDVADLERLSGLKPETIEWGIPLYASEAALHDQIVGKQGAFLRLLESFALLARTGVRIELRTVLMRQNAPELTSLAQFISANLPFISVWAIMQLENIGYARKNWPEIFHDHSPYFDSVGDAISIAAARGVSTRLYNFPLCTVPESYRDFAVNSISDWKQRFLPVCKDCNARNRCCGFFEWYREERGFKKVAAL